MRNFLHETVFVMSEVKKESKDIDWIGSSDGEYAMTWDNFEKLANFEYDNGFGAAEIAQDLIIVFKDGSYMERGEYDGSEWWEYKNTPKKKDVTKPIINLGGPKVMWDTIQELNGGGEK